MYNNRFNKMATSPSINLRVHGLKGLHADVMKKYPRGGRIHIGARLGGVLQETEPVPWGTGIKRNEVSYTIKQGSLKYNIPSSILQEIKASTPRVKLKIYASNYGDDKDPLNIGYIVMDMRDLNRGFTEQTYKINGMGAGGELTMSGKIVTLLTSIEFGPGSLKGLADSIDTTGSALRIEEEELGIALPRYDISVSLDDFKDIAALCSAASLADIPTSNEDSPPPPDANSKFWLCWTLFDQTLHSSTFQKHEAGPTRSVDTIRVQCSHDMLTASLIESFPLRVFICTPGRIIAAAEIPLGTTGVNIPMTISGWFKFFVPLQTMAHTVPGASVHVTVNVICTTPPPPVIEDDGIEEDVQAVFVPDVVPPPPPKENDWVADGRTSHFRLSVDLKTVTNLKRAAHYTVQYSYPKLGSAAPVRTQPMWVQANSEAKIQGGAATFECMMPRAIFKATLSKNPLPFRASSRSHLGTDDLGLAMIDLGKVIDAAPHSYRCPLTSKTFDNRDSYNIHREHMLKLRESGQIQASPPEEPIVVWTHDVFMDLCADVGNGNTSVEGGRVRTVIVIEDMGSVGTSIATKVKPGYKMQGGALYEGSSSAVGNAGGAESGSDNLIMMDGTNDGTWVNAPESAPVRAYGHSMREDVSAPMSNPLDDENLTRIEKQRLMQLKGDWDLWRKEAEAVWREDLRDREIATRKRIEDEVKSALSERAEELRKAQEEATRVESKLRTALENVEKQSTQLTMKEESMTMKMAQKTAELQLLQRRARDESKVKIEAVQAKLEMQERHSANLMRSIEKAEKRAKEAEKDFETYRSYVRSSPEQLLREEVARMKASLAETRAVLERERRLRSESELEKEHFRAQMHRLALALKRERERSSSQARSELEQLRLEFLAREERYVLDGDREELRAIRSEIGSLRKAAEDRRTVAAVAASIQEEQISQQVSNGNSARNQALSRLQRQRVDLLASGMYDVNDPTMKRIDAAIAEHEEAATANA